MTGDGVYVSCLLGVLACFELWRFGAGLTALSSSAICCKGIGLAALEAAGVPGVIIRLGAEYVKDCDFGWTSSRLSR